MRLLTARAKSPRVRRATDSIFCSLVSDPYLSVLGERKIIYGLPSIFNSIFCRLVSDPNLSAVDERIISYRFPSIFNVAKGCFSVIKGFICKYE